MLAARQLGLSEVPAVSLTDLSEAELRVLRLALNRITDDAAWDREALALEFSEILELAPQIDLEVSGFEMGEIDVLLDGRGLEQEDELPPIDASATPVSRAGDLWVLGEHHLLCGDALHAESYARVLGTDKADMMFADPPYNVPIAGHVSGLGAVKHADFVMASGELSSAEFQSFLKTTLGHAASRSIDGAIHFVCMDWRHQRELLAAGEDVYSELMNLCVWNKSNAGMGSLYRSKHELIFVFKVGKGAHINNVALGRLWPAPDQCLGLCQPERIERHREGQACPAPDRQAGGHDRRRDPRLLQPRRPDPRSLRRRRDDPDCGGADWPPRSRDRARSDLRRRQHRALAAADRRHRASCRQRAAVRAVWQRSGGRYWQGEDHVQA